MPRKSLAMAVALLALIIVNPPRLASQQPGALVVDGATLIDGTGSAPVPDSVVVIQNGRIAGIGARGSVQIPTGARVVDAKGKFVIPGLTDAHAHYRSWMGELFLNHGVTTVFDLGNDTDWSLKVRQTEREGKERMPRLFISGQAIGRPGGNFAPSYGADAGSPGRPAPPSTPQGPEWARTTAKALIDKGVDQIKITSDNLTAEEIRAIADEAHKTNRVVLGHTTDIHTSVGSGYDAVVHLWGVSATLMTPENHQKFGEGRIANPYAYMEPSKMDALVSFMIDHKASLNPLLVNEHPAMVSRARDFESTVYSLYINPALRYVPLGNVLSSQVFWHKSRSYSAALGSFPYVETLGPEDLAEARRGYKNAQDFVRRFNKAGGRIIGGTDSGGSALVAGASLLQELQVLVEAGLTPMQALLTVTKNPAEFYHQADKVGTLKVGLVGDVVILDANPLSDIRNVEKISTVIKNGEVLDRRYHNDYHPAFWTAGDDAGRSSSTAAKPTLASVSTKSAVMHGGGPVDLVVTGAAFVTSSLVEVNGRPVKTTFVSPSELHATVPADRLPTAGMYSVTVTTPWAGGGTSEAKALSVP